MKHPFWTLTDTLKWSGIAIVVFAIFLATLQIVSDESGVLYRYWNRYIAMLERKLRSMFIFTPGRLIAIAQLAAMFVVVSMNLTFELPFWWAVLFFIAVGPAVWIEKMRRERITLIEDQLDNFILALANALKTTPSIGSAFNSVVLVVDEPIKSEIDLAIKEMKVGSSLDQALLHMAARVGSRSLDSALSSILIGRQVGGNLPKVLESTAQTLREMKRLEGVIRTKTADGRMQLWVIALMPIFFLVALNNIWPGYFNPLTQSLTGYVLIIFVTGCWVSSLLVARKVLQVDI